jgi:hypothetical protein
MQDIIGGMGHELSGLGFVKIGCGKGLDMGKEPVSYPLLYPPRCSYETSAPDKAKHPD